MYLIFNRFCYNHNNQQLVANITDTKKEFNTLDLNDIEVTNLENVLLFQNRWDNNFRHFLTETFYLLSYVYSDEFKEDGFKIMINKKYQKHSFQILQTLNLSKYIIFKEENHVYKTKHLIWSNRLVDYKDKNFIILLNKLIHNSIKLSNITCHDNIYLSREHCDLFTEKHTPKRWITNLQETTEIFYKNQFKKYVVDNLDIWDQITIIYNAKKIITFMGANCDNITFCNPTSKFFILYAPNQKNWSNWYKFSSSFRGIQCAEKNNSVIYNPVWGNDDQLNGPYKINIELLKKYLLFYSRVFLIKKQPYNFKKIFLNI